MSMCLQFAPSSSQWSQSFGLDRKLNMHLRSFRATKLCKLRCLSSRNSERWDNSWPLHLSNDQWKTTWHMLVLHFFVVVQTTGNPPLRLVVLEWFGTSVLKGSRGLCFNWMRYNSIRKRCETTNLRINFELLPSLFQLMLSRLARAHPHIKLSRICGWKPGRTFRGVSALVL